MSAFRRGSRIYIEFTDAAGKRQRPSTNASTMREAEALEREMKVKVQRQRLGLEAHDLNPNRWTLRQAVEWWIENIGRRQAQGKSAAATLRKHIVGDFGALQLEQVTTARVDEFLASKDDEMAPATVNNLRALLMGVFTKSKKRGKWLGDNPVKGTDRRAVATPAPKTMPVEAVRALLDSVDVEPWRTLIWTAAYTGARRSELVNLSLGLVDLQRGIITLERTKRKKTRVVPIHPELRPVLEAAKAARLTMTIDEVHRSARFVREALAAAGVVMPEGTEATFKMLRTTWTSRLAECGARLDLIRLMGWGGGDNVMETFYLRVGVEALRTEIEKLSWKPSTVVVSIEKAGGRRGL